ncbi:MAG: hypothetical protein ACLQAH_09020 [Limisphaerales bacterium]
MVWGIQQHPHWFFWEKKLLNGLLPASTGIGGRNPMEAAIVGGVWAIQATDGCDPIRFRFYDSRTFEAQRINEVAVILNNVRHTAVLLFQRFKCNQQPIGLVKKRTVAGWPSA